MRISKFTSTVLIAATIALMVASANTKLPHPASKNRVVHFNIKDTLKHIIDYVKSGDHDQHKNTDEFMKAAIESNEENRLGHCGATATPEPWKMLGFTAASIKDTTTKTPVWSNYCFQENYASFQWLDDYSAKVTIVSDKPKFFGCSDTYSITDIYNFDLKVIDEKGSHEIIYHFHEQHGVDYVKKYGLSIIRLCDSQVHLIPDLYLTISLFAFDTLVEDEKGEKTPKVIRDAIFQYHYDWLHHWSGYELVPRK
jgi:hypothetical protein